MITIQEKSSLNFIYFKIIQKNSLKSNNMMEFNEVSITFFSKETKNNK